MVSPTEGAIVDYKDKKRVSTGICLKANTNKTIRLLNDNNKEFNLPETKVLYINSKRVDLKDSRVDILNQLKDHLAIITSRVSDVDISELWELLIDEEIDKYSVNDLVDFYFGSDLDKDEVSVMLKALAEDDIYFDQKNDDYSLKPRSTVDQILNQKRVEEEKEKERELSVNWLSESYRSKEKIEIPSFAEKLVEKLRNLAVFDSKYEKYNDAVGLLHDAGIEKGNPVDNAFKFLIKIGVFDSDENLLLWEYDIPSKFSTAALAELDEFDRNIKTENRVDLRDLETITIDDESTKDIDDAISYKVTDEGCQVGIHIADASEYLKPDTALDREAYNRSTTIYMPDKKVEMLPPKLSEDICSLIADVDKYAVSILINFDNENNIIDFDICESIIKVDKKLSYASADDLIDSDPFLFRLSRIADTLRNKRIETGAVLFSFYDLKVSVSEDKEISLKKTKQDGVSQSIVSELMILSNSMIGKYMSRNNIPCIYKTQEEPGEIVEFDTTIDPYIAMISQRKKMRKSMVSTIPSVHYGLGLSIYSQMTSPIRRYSDLIIHRQLKHFLRTGEAFYDEPKMKDFINYSDHSVRVSIIIERYANKYWLCKYLKDFIGHKTQAMILESNDDRYFIQLTEFLIEMPLLKEPGFSNFEVGDKIDVVIQNVKERKGNIFIRVSKDSDSDLPVLYFDNVETPELELKEEVIVSES